jgi:hypothetical protein
MYEGCGGSARTRWFLFPDAARLAKCNETMLLALVVRNLANKGQTMGGVLQQALTTMGQKLSGIIYPMVRLQLLPNAKPCHGKVCGPYVSSLVVCSAAKRQQFRTSVSIGKD